MTGITRVSKESIFPDLNNLKVVTTTSDKYADCFGFMEEVFAALDEYGMSEQKQLNNAFLQALLADDVKAMNTRLKPKGAYMHGDDYIEIFAAGQQDVDTILALIDGGARTMKRWQGLSRAESVSIWWNRLNREQPLRPQFQYPIAYFLDILPVMGDADYGPRETAQQVPDHRTRQRGEIPGGFVQYQHIPVFHAHL